MRMTAAEFELLAGMQAWAERNAAAIGQALAEHTFTAGPAGGFLREYANSKGMPRRRRSRRAGAPPRPATSRTSSSRPPSRGGFGVKYFEGLLGVGALHSKINLPLKWFLGTYPVFIDLVHEAMLADVPEPARVGQEGLRPQGREHRLPGAGRRRARAQPHLQLRLAGDRRGLLLRHVRVDGREPEDDGRRRPGSRHLRPLRHRAQHDARDPADVRRLDLRGPGHVLDDERAPVRDRPGDQRDGRERVARRRGVRAPGRRRRPGPQLRRPGLQRRRVGATEHSPHTASTRRWARPPRSTTPASASRRPRRRSPPSPAARSRSAASSRRSTTSPARPTCSRSTPRSRPPAPASAARASPSSPTRSASWPSAPAGPPPTPAS